MSWGLRMKHAGISIPCSILRRIVSSQRGCTAVGRQAARSRCATLPLTSGTVMPRRDGNGISHQKNYSAVSLPRISWRVSRSGIPNIAGSFPLLRNRMNMHGKNQRKEKPMNLKKYKSAICIVAAVGLLAAAAFCGYHIYHHYAQVDEQTEAFSELAEIVDNALDEEEIPEDTPVSEGEDILAKYRELYLQNEDMVGWISIAGTTINYPVMQTKNNPNFYLKHDFEKEYSDLGVPYIQENCDLATSDNLIIYGHHITGQRMFGVLESYKDKSFYEEHKTIQFDTLTEQAEYEIIAVFKTVAYSSEGYRYYDFVDAENEDEFNAYVGKCRELALYDTGVTAEYGDRLITLSTCEYSAQNGRLVVVAKKAN